MKSSGESVHYDLVVVGAGGAGSAVAARVSEHSDRNVLVVDAGPLYSDPSELASELLEPGRIVIADTDHPHQWSFVGRVTDDLSYSVPRGRGLGGSSGINGSYFIRGIRDDFEQWARLGNPGWGFEDVLPFFCRLEHDRNFRADYHGTSGPIGVERVADQELHPITQAFTASCIDRGHREAADNNAPGAEGVGPVPLNIADGRRQNAGVFYLLPHLDRPNLTLMGEAFVRRVLLEGNRAVGVEVEQAGRLEKVYAGEIILCAGAVKSPHLLLLSGIGPANQLERNGVKPLVDLPGVGAELSDHPVVTVLWTSSQEFLPIPGQGALHAALNYRTEGSPFANDMEIYPLLAPFTLGAPNLGEELPLVVTMQQEHSRGQLGLQSDDPHVPPSIEYRYLSSGDDRRRLREGVLEAVEILKNPAFDEIRVGLTDPGPSDLDSEESLDSWLDRHLWTAIHMSCTCHMGPDSDRLAVVDSRGCVKGVDGLRVADTSIMPRITSRGPSATAIMIGERIAATIVNGVELR